MKWRPRPLRAGDMIRVRLGSVYHYGIFAGEEEVIQFGPPPTPATLSDSRDFCVMATDIDTFSCGVIVEGADPETREERRRFPPKKTLKLARAAMGETGYDLIRNNCEHFAFACVYGVRHSTQAEEARRRFYARPILNLYVLPLAEGDRAVALPDGVVYPPAREAEIKAAPTPDAAREKYAAWYLLEKALSHAFAADIRDLTFARSDTGKWTCREYAISISHTKGAVAVAVSNGPLVGVDLENEAAFLARHADHLPALAARTLTPDEAAEALTPRAYLSLWTRKESLYKYGGTGTFDPLATPARPASPPLRTLSFDLDNTPMVLSVCGDRMDALACYLLTPQDPPCRLPTTQES